MKRKLRIAQIAPLWAPIPPKRYGGSERIVSLLTEELVLRGHKVTLFASGNSKTSAKLVSITKKNLLSREIPWIDWTWNLLNYVAAFRQSESFDIYHAHLGFQGMILNAFVKKPLVATFHNTPSPHDHRWEAINYLSRDVDISAVFVSKAQKSKVMTRFTRNFVVHNGLDPATFRFNGKPENHLVWLARVEHNKGIEQAIVVSKLTGMELILAGRVGYTNEEFFKTKVKPHLSRKIRFVGELTGTQVRRLLRGAKAFLYPIDWEEPFGLVMIEAMACGTPVIAFDRGSVREIVEDKVTGFIVPPLDRRGRVNIKGLVEAVRRVDEIDRMKCRESVEQYFNQKRMADEYEKIYYKSLRRAKEL